MDKDLKSRWVFTLGDYIKLYENGKLDMEKYDFIFIDALHEEQFSRGYCQRLLSPLKRKAIVAIHDIVADAEGGGRESAEVYKFLAFAGNSKNVFTMSPYGMPNSLYIDKAKEIVPKLNEMRANLGIVKKCSKESSCKNPEHDYLYFENGSAPTLFFQLN